MSVDGTTGAFRYTPTVSARYLAEASTGVDTDTFSVNITDTAGNITGPTFIHTVRDYDSSSANSSTFVVYHNDWTSKLAVDVIEEVIVENEAIITAEEAQSAAADGANL